MKKNQLINTCLLVAVLFSSLQTNAQQFAYAAKIDEIKTSGFYKIPILPQVNAKLQLSSFDLRIVNEQNKQIAYIIEQEEATFKTQHFIDFPILKKEKEKDKQTHITIANVTKQSINDLLLITANMQAKRFVNISGSNNLNDWYIIKENIELENYFGNNQATFVQSIGLPTVNYAYFKITVLGEDILPVNIVQAGIYTQNYSQGKYTELPIPSFKQIDSSNKNSYIQISFTDAYVIDKLMVEVSGPKFFKRNLNLYAGNTINTSYPYSATINATTTQLSLAGLKSRDILLQINNDDNEPLKIQSIKAFQLQEYVLAYLESGHHYKLLFGDSLAEQPKYDLAAFKDSINKNLPILNIGAIESIEYKLTTSQTSNSNKNLLWIALFAVVLILLLFSYKMVQEIKRKK